MTFTDYFIVFFVGFYLLVLLVYLVWDIFDRVKFGPLHKIERRIRKQNSLLEDLRQAGSTFQLQSRWLVGRRSDGSIIIAEITTQPTTPPSQDRTRATQSGQRSSTEPMSGHDPDESSTQC